MGTDGVKKVSYRDRKAVADSTRSVSYVQNGKRTDGTNISQQNVFGDDIVTQCANGVFVAIPVVGAGKKTIDYKRAKRNKTICTEGKCGLKAGRVRRQANQLLECMNEKAPTPSPKGKTWWNPISWFKKSQKAARTELLQKPENRKAWSKLTNAKNTVEYDNALKELNKNNPKGLKNVQEYLRKYEPKVDLRETAYRRHNMKPLIEQHTNALRNGSINNSTINRLNRDTKNLINIGRNSAKGTSARSLTKSLSKIRGKAGKGAIVGAVITLALSGIMGAVSSAEKRSEIRSLNLSEGKEKELIKRSNGKEWTKTGIETAGVGAGIAAGAGIGAAIGTVVPGIGNVVGAIVGGVVGGILAAVGTWGAGKINNNLDYTRKSAIEDYEEELTKKFEQGKMSNDELHDFNELQKAKNKAYLQGQIEFNNEDDAKKFHENMIKINNALIKAGQNPIPNDEEVDLIDDSGTNLSEKYRKNAMKVMNAENKEEKERYEAYVNSLGDDDLKKELKKQGINLEGEFSSKKARKALNKKKDEECPTNPWFNPWGWFNNSNLQSKVAKLSTREAAKKSGQEIEYKCSQLGYTQEDINNALANGVSTEDLVREINEEYDNTIDANKEVLTAQLTMNDDDFEAWAAKQQEEIEREAAAGANTNTSTTTSTGTSATTSTTSTTTDTDPEDEELSGNNTDASSTTSEAKEEVINPFSLATLGASSDYSWRPAWQISDNNTYTGGINFGNNAFGNYWSSQYNNTMNNASLWSFTQPFSAYQYDNGYVGQMPSWMINPWMMYGNGNNGSAMA